MSAKKLSDVEFLNSVVQMGFLNSHGAYTLLSFTIFLGIKFVFGEFRRVLKTFENIGHVGNFVTASGKNS